MYCTCSNKKKIVMTILHERVEVCSKRLGGCGKEIGELKVNNNNVTYTGSSKPWSGTLDDSFIGRTFITRDGTVVKLAKIQTNTALSNTYYPCTFVGSDNNGAVEFTTTTEGKFNMHSQHPRDIVSIV